LQQHGGLRKPVDTITHATGGAVSPEPLLDYLELKFGDIYGL
jgi:carboxypeptidase Taq